MTRTYRRAPRAAAITREECALGEVFAMRRLLRAVRSRENRLALTAFL